MNMTDFSKKVQLIYEHLQDDESKKIFEARLDYFIDRNTDNYIKKMLQMYSDWKCCVEVYLKEEELGNRCIVIYGCGRDGVANLKLLKLWNYKVECFCDNYCAGKKVEDIDVISVDDAVEKYKEAIWIIGSRKYRNEMIKDLQQRRVDEVNILWLHHEYLFAMRGEQYFDLFEPAEQEVFVDAGCFDGKTIEEFWNWLGEREGKVYSFEPIKRQYDDVREKFEKDDRVTLYNYATWDKEETISFADTGDASRPCDEGEAVCKGIDLDTVLKGEKVTYLKMDVEGSELKTLQGAKNIIVRDKPRLAISIYHKPEDFMELALYVLELVPEYKFYIRQYTSDTRETVLYATI